MAENSKIEWTKHTANLWHGCMAVHEGCFNCYAEVLSHRWGNDLWGADKPRKAIKSVWNDITRFQKEAEKAGEMHSVFVGSMMDIAEKPMPLVDSKGNPIEPIGGQTIDTSYLRNIFFNSVVPASPNLRFLLLTKRPSNFNKVIPESWKQAPPENVMFGCSVVSPKTLRMVDWLREVNGYRFLSIEPQLEYIPEIDLTGIDWVIVGGESGPKRRPFNPDWGRRLRDICHEQGVAFFFKQIDKVQAIPDDLLIRQFPVLQSAQPCTKS